MNEYKFNYDGSEKCVALENVNQRYQELRILLEDFQQEKKIGFVSRTEMGSVDIYTELGSTIMIAIAKECDNLNEILKKESCHKSNK